MKLKSLMLAAMVAISPAAFAAETAPLTFNGVLTMSDATQFGLTTADGSKSGWVKLGGSFDGYVLKSYDAPSETLTLERAGQPYTLSLSGGKFTGTATGVTGTKATLADAQAVVDHAQRRLHLGFDADIVGVLHVARGQRLVEGEAGLAVGA